MATSSGHKDYSKTALSQKLGAKPGLGVLVATVQQIGLDTGLVDNKSAAIDERWQALRFVIRVEDR